MRIQHVLTLIGAAALSASAFAAPASVTPDAEGSAIASVAVTASTASYKLRPFELNGVQGSYALADGRTLHISSEHRRLYAELDNARAEIVPVAENTFVSRDDGMQLRFDQIPFASEVTLTMPASK